MKNIRLLLLHTLLAFQILHAGTDTNNYKIIFTDNTAVTGGPNDMGQTGDFEFIYTHPEKKYTISAKYELFVNTAPGDNNVTRENKDNLRTDLFSVYFVQGDAFKYGLGFEILGDLGGDTIQNTIHDLTSNPHIPAQYIDEYRVTPTVNYTYSSTLFENKIDFVSTGKLPLIFQNGIAKVDAMFTYTMEDLYDLGLNLGIGLGVDCTRYPDIPAFQGSPINEYQLCTPETRLTLMYGNFDIFWEIPLMNNTVQNSVLGIGYRF